MRLSTIWTIKVMSFSERLRRTREWANWQIATHLPLRLRYAVALSEITKATVDNDKPSETQLVDILLKLDKPEK